MPGWLPEGQITLLAADGGVGKTSLWVDLAAAVSSGRPCLLDDPGHSREPGTVLFMTTEDSVRKKLKKKLRQAGADMSRVVSPDFSGDGEGILRELKFGTGDMAQILRYIRPKLCIFDPVQGFVPPEINMGSRNAMRDCMAPLVALGEELGTTFLVVCHTNKRKGASGRDRIADSADLWDVARSVLMSGFTGEPGVRYLSNEKNNYAPLQESRLFTITDTGLPQPKGTTWKRDRDYQQSRLEATQKPTQDSCKAWILQELAAAGGKLKTTDLDERARLAGYPTRLYQAAKAELKSQGGIDYTARGDPRRGVRVWHITLSDKDIQELPPTTPVPFC